MKRICICVCLGEEIKSNFFVSFIGLQQKGEDWEVKDVATTQSMLTYHAMEKGAEKFLETNNDWLLFLETDMRHPSDTIPRLLRHDKPVVSGVQTWKTKPFAPMVYRYRPKVLWGVGKDDQWKTGPYQAVTDFKDDELLQVDAVPCGCLLVRRDVFEKAERPWFSFSEGTQDMFFSRRVLAAGFPIYVDTSVSCTHFTTIGITMAEHRRYMAAHPEEKRT